MSDYLFDKQEEPDPEVVELERLLSPLAYRGAAPRLPARRSRRAFVVAGALSALAAAALVALLIARPWRPSWAATVEGGTATSDGHALGGATRLSVGAWLETQSGHVRLQVADIGTVELAQNTRARIVATGAARHEMQLERGTLVATIDAPPRHFVVTTPRAVVTDLGCAFELTVDESGRGRLVVTAGKVAVSSAGAPEVVVPAGARVELTARGPGVPYVPHAEPTPTPTPPVPSAPTPTPVPSAPAHASKPSHHAVHTKTAPAAAAHKPIATTPPATRPAHTQPAHKTEPTKIEHDALKELQKSVE